MATAGHAAKPTTGTTSAATVSTAPSPTDTGGDVRASYSNRGVVRNLSGDTLRVTAVTGDDKWDGEKPVVGTLIAPGSYQSWRMTYDYLRNNGAGVHFELIKPDGSKDGDITVDFVVYPKDLYGSSGIDVTGRSINSQSKLRFGADRGDGSLISVEDAPGTVRNLDGSRPNSNAESVLSLCGSGLATCSFASSSETEIMGPNRVVGSMLGNTTDLEQSKSVTITDTESSADSLGGSITLKVPIAPVELSVQATYNHTWTKTHSFAETTTVKAAPKNWGWVTSRAPYLRHTGTFSVKTANTTFRITDVSVDSPDPVREAVVYVHNRPMTEAELVQARQNERTSGNPWTGPSLELDTGGTIGG